MRGKSETITTFGNSTGSKVVNRYKVDCLDPNRNLICSNDCDEAKGLQDDDTERVAVGDDVREGGDGLPHDALFFVLEYMETGDLLAVETVCKSLRDAITYNPLIWRNIRIGPPFSQRITYNFLLKLTSRAQGLLQSLTLVDCWDITDDGLSRILGGNPKLTKLTVIDCKRFTVEGILRNLRDFKSIATFGIKSLRIGFDLGLRHEKIEQLKSLLGVLGNGFGGKPHIVHYYIRRKWCVSLDMVALSWT